MPGYIHHIEWCVSDLQNQVQKLVSQYGFQPIGQRIRKIQNILDVKTHWVVQQVAVQSGDTIFIITQKSRTSSYENQHIGKLDLCISLIFLDPTLFIKVRSSYGPLAYFSDIFIFARSENI